MAKQLWLLRHGDAEPHGQLPDELRALTERGVRQARAAGAALAALEAHIDAVLCSPRTRALDTARIACQALPASIAPRVHDPLSAGFDCPQALDLMAGFPDAARVLLVGHEPDFSLVLRALTGACVDLKKGGLAMARIDAAASPGDVPAELVLLVRPRELALIEATRALSVHPRARQITS
jgi:phosphohistidine phosphatase